MNRLKTKEDLRGLLYASTASAALGAAIESGLLWLLADTTLSAPQIVEALRIPGKRGYYWLQLLEQIGILENGTDGYTTSDLVRQVILETYSQESWQHLALDERERSSGVHNLALYISEPDSIWGIQGLPAPKDYVEKMRNSLARAREFHWMLFEVHQSLANSVAEALDFSGAQRLMDLGGGSGVISMALVRKYPGLTATVVDIENVCVAGREIAAHEGLSDRIQYHPTEFSRDEFPSGFDVVMQCDVLVFGNDHFHKIWRALKPGGRLVFVETFSPSEDRAPLGRLEWSFLDSLDNPDFYIPTIDQLHSQLIETGFEVLPVQQVPGSVKMAVWARKPEAL